MTRQQTQQAQQDAQAAQRLQQSMAREEQERVAQQQTQQAQQDAQAARRLQQTQAHQDAAQRLQDTIRQVQPGQEAAVVTEQEECEEHRQEIHEQGQEDLPNTKEVEEMADEFIAATTMRGAYGRTCPRCGQRNRGVHYEVNESTS